MLSFKKLFKNRDIIVYGLSLGAVFFLLQWMEYRFVVISHLYEIYITLIAIIFTALGVWLALKLSKPKVETRVETVIIEKQVSVANNSDSHFSGSKEKGDSIGLSAREIEVLSLMAMGLSNQEIADRLFVSLNTVKTHSSRLFEKMDVKRRTQAIEKAKRLQIIP